MPPKGPKGGQGPNAADNKLGQYKYTAMSNLVLQADRRFINRSKDEPTGDPESLAGRINIKDMGARTSRDSAPVAKRLRTELNIERGGLDEGADVLRQQKRNRGDAAQGRGTGILSQQDLQIEGLRYKPRTPQTREVFNLITTIVARHLGDVPATVTRSAADAVLEYLKDDDLKDFDKKKEVDDILGASMGSKEFNELVNLGKKITDYNAQDEDEEMGDAGEGADDELDDRQGVAVQFGDEDEDEQTFEVREEGDATDDEAAGDADEDEEQESKPAEVDEDGEMIIGSKPIDEVEQKDAGIVPAYEIDEYWLSRQVGKAYTDAHEQSEKTRAAFEILEGVGDDGEEKPLREIENDLMELFDYEYPELVGKLVLNRDKIVWVTRWRRVSEDSKARSAIEREIVAAGHRGILKELQTREAAGAEANGDSGKMKFKDIMDIDIKSGQSKAEGAEEGKSLENLQPKRLLNLENYAFEQGNHLMTNPNVKLPPGSTKRTFKGWEEIHVPAPKRVSGDQAAEIPTAQALPDWARIGFGTAPRLNRIQSKCFPSAFHDDGNMLICAPTGSGKTNVAMLTMLREIGKHRDDATGAIDLDAFKIVYISPLKALVAEQTGNFGKRLAPYNINVAELTGDRQLTKAQIAETQVIVTTPEKWDVITRKVCESRTSMLGSSPNFSRHRIRAIQTSSASLSSTKFTCCTMIVDPF
jgi:pre-mRNA-splicing helicase BRR2